METNNFIELILSILNKHLKIPLKLLLGKKKDSFNHIFSIIKKDTGFQFKILANLFLFVKENKEEEKSKLD